MFKVLSALVLIFVFNVPHVVASGGGGGGYSGGGGHGGSGFSNRKVDKRYEYGKAIYTGRVPDIGKVKYCLEQEGERVKVKRSTLKRYKRKPVNELATNLYHCDQPEVRIISTLGKQNTLYVLYYLNKRYKLKTPEFAK